jgi:hypothetical protein
MNIMPPDRSGNTDNVVHMNRSGESVTENRLSAKERYAQEKEAKKKKKEQEEMTKAMGMPVTQIEFHKRLMGIFAGMEKLAGEIRALGVRGEGLLQLLFDNNVITREDFVAYSQMQVDWNAQIDTMTRALDQGEVELREIVRQLTDWNEANQLKITWHHLDLAPRIMKDEILTMEEKLLIASELDMPERFIEELRRLQGDYSDYSVNDLNEGITESIEKIVNGDEPALD